MHHCHIFIQLNRACSIIYALSCTKMWQKGFFLAPEKNYLSSVSGKLSGCGQIRCASTATHNKRL